MNSIPLVSIIMATYNTEYCMLQSAIESILNQTYKNIELIIIDDCSTEYNDFSFIDSYMDNRIVFIRNSENKGLAYSLNRGFEIARGKYIARMDSDDISLPNRIEKQVEYLELHKEIFVLGSSVRVFGTTNAIRENLIDNPEFIRASFLFHNALTHPSVMLNRKFLTDNNLRYDEIYRKSQDYELWTRVCAFGPVIHELQEVLLLYRTFPGQASSPEKNKDQRYYADCIRRRELLRFCNPTELEMECHLSLSYGHVNAIDKKDVDSWCKKLIKINKDKKYYNHHYFLLALSNQYISLYKCSSGLSLFGWSYFETMIIKMAKYIMNWFRVRLFELDRYYIK